MTALPYATTENVKQRLNITDTDEDDFIDWLVEEMNAYVESQTYRQVGPFTVTNELLDGWDALEDGRCILYPKGIRSITSLEVAAFTGDSFTSIPSTDYFLRPTQANRQPGWPAFEIWMTDIPSASNSLPYFQQGFANIRLTADAGWEDIPLELREVAEVTVVRAFKASMSGQTDQSGTDEIGVPVVSRFVSGRDRSTLLSYRWKVPEI